MKVMLMILNAPVADLKVIDWLLAQPVAPTIASLPALVDWKKLFDKEIIAWTSSLDRAIVGGWLSDRMSYAFAAGYESALRRLVPDLPLNTLIALCITEEGGGHPQAIQTTLKPTQEFQNGKKIWILEGQKKFVTCANEAEILLVAASIGVSKDGKNQIRLVQLDRHTAGITIEPLTHLPFVLEISHGAITFSQAHIEESQIFPEDGYLRYVKPFRTIEDCHVFAGILAFIFRVAVQFTWPNAVKEQLLTLLVSLKAITPLDPLAPEVHIVLGGIIQQAEKLLKETAASWGNVEFTIRKSWERDQPLLQVAGSARVKRLTSAWKHYS